MTLPDYASFAREIIGGGGSDWASNWDGGSISDMAVKYGIIHEVKYDPDVHESNDIDVEPGDPWFVFVEEAGDEAVTLELNVLQQGNQLQIAATVDLEGLLKLQAILNIYEAILESISKPPETKP